MTLPNASSSWVVMRCLNSASSASEASGLSESTASISSSQRSSGCPASLNGSHSSLRNSFVNAACDRVAVAADALDERERGVQRNAERDDLFGGCQQRRARDFEAVVAERHEQS